jgi:hypothetical protein
LRAFLPEYFAQDRKPDGVSSSAWTSARQQLEDVAREALARYPARVASSH